MFEAIISGIVEGITEFLPISSTGHLIILNHFLGINQDSFTNAFNIIIQLGAILAVVFLYKEEIKLSKFDLWKKVFIAYLPLAIIGFIFKDSIDSLFNTFIVAIMFIIGGIIFILVDKKYKGGIDNLDDISIKQALFVGLAQVLALIPGTSRSGATIIGGIISGLNKEISAKFSFLVAIPVMFSVSGYDILKYYSEFSNEDIKLLLVGFFVSFFVALLTIKVFMKFLNFSFIFFGIYRIVFGLVILCLQV